jgi:tetratricopeptide (TPR) repeat protein
MEGRKVAWLLCGILSGMIGCSHSDTRAPGIPAPPPPPKTSSAPAANDPNLVKLDKEPKEEPKVLNAKPASCVKIGDFKTQMAFDTTSPRTAAEREAFAQQARQAYQRALQLDPKFVPAWLGLAVLCEGMGDRDEAMSHYRTVLKFESHNVSAYVGIARTYEAAGMREEAISTYDAAVAAMPREAALWHDRGMCLGRAKQLDDALASLQRAAKLRPNMAEYNKDVGMMLARLGRGDEAVGWLIKVMPEADARYNVARMLEHIGQRQAAFDQLSMALKAHPTHVAALKMMSEGQIESGPHSESVRPTAYQDEELPPQAVIQQTSTLPARPSAARPVVTAERPAEAAVERPAASPPAAPLIPVTSDSWEGKPPLTGPADSVPRAKSEPKPRPRIVIGFDERP